MAGSCHVRVGTVLAGDAAATGWTFLAAHAASAKAAQAEAAASRAFDFRQQSINRTEK